MKKLFIPITAENMGILKKKMKPISNIKIREYWPYLRYFYVQIVAAFSKLKTHILSCDGYKIALLLFVLVVPYAKCSSSNSILRKTKILKQVQDDNRNKKPHKLTVVLDWFINPNHAPIFVAEQEGFFKQQGLQIKLIAPADASSGEKMVAANKADIVITYQPKLMRMVTQGLPLIRFATLIDKPLNCFVTLDDGAIQSIKDLKDKNIGQSTQNMNDSTLLSTMLQNAGLTIKDINPIYVKFNLMSALLTKKIDGFSGGMRNVEPLAIELLGKHTKLFYPEEYGFPEYDELIFVTNKNKIHDLSLIKFVKALKLGVLYLKKNPHKAWQKFSRLHPALNNSLNKKIWFTTLKYFAIDPAKLERTKYEELAKFLWNKRSIKTIPKIETYAYELTVYP